MPPEDVANSFVEKRYFRPSKQPSIPLPFGARSTGYARGKYSIDYELKNVVHVFWGLSGEATFHIGHRHYVLKPDHVIFCLPGERRHYWTKDGWSVRWLSIDGTQALQVFNSLGLKRKPRHAGPCPEDMFVALERQVCDPTPDGERAASATAYGILVRAASGPPSAGADFHVVSRSVDIISKHLTDADLCVKRLADELGWNRSSFTRAFTAGKGIPPSKYITALRMQKAIHLVLSTPMRVSEIAQACGYADPKYFDKVFRKTTGNSPREFRMRQMISHR